MVRLLARVIGIGIETAWKENYRRHFKDFCQTLQRHGGGVALACFQAADVGAGRARSLRKRGLS
jgi:hypothetical protein